MKISKRILSLALALVMVLALMPELHITADAAAAEPITTVIDTGAEITLTDADGDGFYDIKTADDLFAFSSLVCNDYATYKSINVELLSDIDVNPGYVFHSDGTVTKDGAAVTEGWRVWLPVCKQWGDYYLGHFNGNYHTITGLYYTGQYAAFIRFIRDASVVENVGLENTYFYAPDDGASGFIYNASGDSSTPVIRNCWAAGTVIGDRSAAGMLNSASIRSCEYGCILENCFYSGNIISTYDNVLFFPAGGVRSGTVKISNCFYDNSKLITGSSKKIDGGFTGVTTEQFVNGHVAYLMGDVYGQNIDNGQPASSHPIFNGPQVYKVGPCSNTRYSNTPGEITHNNDLVEDKYYNDDDLCIYCGTKAYPSGICSNPVYGSTPGEMYHDNNKVDSKYYDENGYCLKCGALRSNPITELWVSSVAVVEDGVVKTTSGTGWSFDSATATLTLTDGASLYSGGKDSNKLHLASGIYCEGDLNIISNGTVSVDGYYYGIYINTGLLNLDVQSGTLTVNNTFAISSAAYGLSANIAENTVLNLRGDRFSFGYSGAKSVALSGKGTVNCSSTFDADSGLLKIDGITLNFQGTATYPDLSAKNLIIGENSPATLNLMCVIDSAVRVTENVRIIGSKVTIGPKSGTTWVYGFYASSITVEDSVIIMEELKGSSHTNFGFVGNLTVSGNSHIRGRVSSPNTDRGFCDGTVTVNGNYYYRTGSSAAFEYNTVSAAEKIDYFELITESHLGYVSNSDTHSKVCGDENCPAHVVVDTASHEGGTATCVALAVCEVCGAEYGYKDSDNHTGEETVEWDWNNHGDGTCYVETSLRCADCDAQLDSNSGEATLVNTVEGTNCVNPGSQTFSITLTLGDREYSETKTFIIPNDNHTNMGANGICSGCGGYQPAVWNEEESVYEISNAGQLMWFAELVNGGETDAKGVLTADIDLNGITWIPIGGANSYTGTFDGNGKTIAMGNQTATQSNYGIIGKMSGATVKNLNVTGDLTVDATVEYLAGVVGYSQSGTIENCNSYVNITLTENAAGSKKVAGIVGSFENGTGKTTVSKCANYGNIIANGAEECVSGISGYANRYDKITDCANYGNITANNVNYVAGILAYVNYNTFGGLQNCLNTGTVTGNTTYVGDIMGWARDYTAGTITNNYYTGSNGFGAVNSGKEAKAEQVNAEQLASGEVAFKLGDAWGQTIGTDSYPTPGGAKVYYGYTDCFAAEKIYTNKVAYDEKPEHAIDSTTGKCPFCEMEMAQAKVTSGDVDTYYETLASALGAAKSGDTVTLCKDVDIGETDHTIPQGVTFAGGEYTVDGRGAGWVNNEGTIVSGKFAFCVDNSGTIQGGKFTFAVLNHGDICGGSFLNIDCGMESTLSGPVTITSSIQYMDECRIDLREASVEGAAVNNGTEEDLPVSIFNLPEGYALEFNDTVVSVLPAWETGYVVKHTHTFETRYDETHHWTECVCGKTTEKAAHSAFEYTDKGDGTHDKVCTECGSAVTEDHTAFEYTDEGDGTHDKVCSECGSAVTEDHTPDETVGQTCKGYQCAGCGVWYGEATEHNYVGNTCTVCGDVLKARFEDVSEGQYFYEPVEWAVEKGITKGTSDTEFSPNENCNRAQVVTFLWRAAGSPEPSSTENPFTDVKEGDFYYKAVLWAVEKGITKGTSDTEFSPSENCNRAQVVTFLWRAQGSPASDTAVNFNDVRPNQYYTTAVAWAVEKGITNGISDTEFGIFNICNRAQAVTFLYRTMAE